VSNERQQRAARAEQMRKEREKADRKQRNMITVAIVVVVVTLIAVGGFAVKKASDDNASSTAYVAPANLSSAANFAFDYTATDAGGAAPTTDPVKVVLYEDFQCPVCKAFEAADGAFLDNAVKTGQITIEYRPYAFLDRSSSTRYATRAMNAAMCVLDEGGAAVYKKMHDILYANQPEEGTAGLPDSDLIDFAKQAGATGTDSCINTEKFSPWVKKAKAKVESDGVTGTPTVRIGGKDVNNSAGGAPTVADLQAAITAAAKA